MMKRGLRWSEDDFKKLKHNHENYPLPRKHKIFIGKSRMNKTETRYANEILEPLKVLGEIEAYVFEGVKFRLADRTYYTPDFMVITTMHGIEFHEVKGFLRDDAAVKFKVVRENFPWFTWKMVRHRKGEWAEVKI
jgi:hypothetical protein